MGAAAMHELLLRQAGFVPDRLLVRARTELAEGAVGRAAEAVLAEGSPPITVDDLTVLSNALGTPVGVRPELERPPIPWRFQAAPPGLAAATQGLTSALVAALGAEPAVHGLWCAQRLPWEAPDNAPSRLVYVVEADAGDLAGLTGRLQRALAEAGDRMPLVEVVASGSEWPPYQRTARAYGVLTWAATPEPVITVAACAPASDTLERADGVLAYLRAGTVLMRTTAKAIDVVDADRGAVVPRNCRTDGRWIWTDEASYYLDRYGRAPDPGLLAHIAAADGPPPALDAVAVHRALARLREHRASDAEVEQS